VFYADRFTLETEEDRAKTEGDELCTVSILKRFVVPKVAQCDGPPERSYAPINASCLSDGQTCRPFANKA
jgi:antirestriction protein ArdC